MMTLVNCTFEKQRPVICVAMLAVVPASAVTKHRCIIDLLLLNMIVLLSNSDFKYFDFQDNDYSVLKGLTKLLRRQRHHSKCQKAKKTLTHKMIYPSTWTHIKLFVEKFWRVCTESHAVTDCNYGDTELRSWVLSWLCAVLVRAYAFVHMHCT